MLPQDFDTSVIKDATLRKVANTLKVYGAYVVDMNYGTPFVIYVEIGSGLKIGKGGWNYKLGQELHLVRENLRMVKAAGGWLDDNGQPFTPNKNLNLLSMRGPWVASNGKPLGKFVPTQQAVVFQNTDSPVIQSNYSDRSMPAIDWAKPQKGQRYTLKAVTTGGASLRFKIIDKETKKQVYDSRDLQNNESVTFEWPVDGFYPLVTVTSGVGDASSARGILFRSADK